MATQNAQAHHILIPVSQDYEDLEVWYPAMRLRGAGVRVTLATPGGAPCTGKHGYPLKPDAALADVTEGSLTGIMVPGGWSPDQLRRIEHLLDICRALDARKGLVASICHGPWVLVSARILKGRTLTCTPGIRDDVENAGGVWRDEAVVTDGNLITSRRPPDLPAFGEALVDWLHAHPRR